MNNIEVAYWKLLKAGLWNNGSLLEDFTPLADKVWRRIIGMAQRSGALGIVTDAVEMLPDAAMPERNARLTLVKQKVSLMKKHEKHNLVIRHLIALMDELGFKAVLLKGQSLAQNFEKSESRNIGDIDVFIGEQHMDALVDKLTALGHTCEEEINDTEKHVVFIFEDIPIELHRVSLYLYTSKTNRLYQQWWDSTIFSQPEKAYIDEKGKWQKENVPGAQCVLMPETTLNVFFTFCHLFGHYMGFQFQYKQFMDLARMLKAEKDNIDVPLLGSKLKQLGMLQPWQVVGCYLHKTLGLDKECIPLYNSKMEHKADKFGRQIHKRIFESKSPESKRPSGRIASKLYSYKLEISFAMKAYTIFPKQAICHLGGDTLRGIKLLFNSKNRTQGTHTHYLERTKGKA